MQTIATVLSAPATLILARLAVTSFFWISAGISLLNFKRMVQGVAKMGLPLPILSASAVIACQIIGSAWLIFDLFGMGWIGSTILIAFTLMTIPFGHPFWKYNDEKRSEELNITLEHITVVGGLVLAAILSGQS